MKIAPHIKRKFGKYTVLQRKRDGMYCVNEFLKLWNRQNKKDRVPSHKHFLALESTKVFIKMLSEQLEGEKLVEENLIKNGGNWFDPRLFIEFLNYVNPQFKVDAVNLFYEAYHDVKKDAAENYKSLSSAAKGLDGFDEKNGYREVAKGLQWIVFGFEGKNLQDRANEAQLKERYELELKLVFAIERGFIVNYKHLLWMLREIYREKYPERIKPKE